MAAILVVVSKVKARATDAEPDFRVGADAIEGLSEMVGEVVTEAVGQAKAAGRKTVKKQDVRDAIKALNAA